MAMCHYQEIFGVKDYTIESQIFIGKLYLLKSKIQKIYLLQALPILFSLSIACSAVPKLMKLVVPVPNVSNERFFLH